MGNLWQRLTKKVRVKDPSPSRADSYPHFWEGAWRPTRQSRDSTSLGNASWLVRPFCKIGLENVGKNQGFSRGVPDCTFFSFIPTVADLHSLCNTECLPWTRCLAKFTRGDLPSAL